MVRQLTVTKVIQFQFWFSVMCVIDVPEQGQRQYLHLGGAKVEGSGNEVGVQARVGGLLEAEAL